MESKQNKEPLIIGLYSPVPQSGKSTLTEYLEQHFRFHPVAIANPIKQLVRQLLLQCKIEARVVDQLMEAAKETPIPKLGNKSVRELCQSLGKDWGRDLVGEDLWLNILMSNLHPDHAYVIDGLRFPNEYHAIKARGGEVWKIIRPDAVLPNDHASEGLLDDYPFDRVLINDGAKQEFFQQLILTRRRLH